MATTLPFERQACCSVALFPAIVLLCIGACCGQDKTNSDARPKLPSNASNRGTDPASSSDLLSAVLAGIRSCRSKVVTAEFTATETVESREPDGKVTTSRRHIRCVFDREQRKLRHEYTRDPIVVSAGPRVKGSEAAKASVAAVPNTQLSFTSLFLPDLTAYMAAGNDVTLLPPNTMRGDRSLWPIDPVVAGVSSTADLSRHWNYNLFEAFVSRSIAKEWIVVVNDGNLYRLDFRIPASNPGVATPQVEIERRTWIDPLRGFAPIKTEMRSRRLPDGAWNEPSITKVQWTKRGDVFVPTMVESRDKANSGHVDSITVAIAWSKLNEAIDGKEFDYHLLPAGPGALIVDRRINPNEPVVVGPLAPHTAKHIVATMEGQRPRRYLPYLWALNIAGCAILAAVLIWRKRSLQK